MFDFARRAKGGTDDTDRPTAVALNFEVKPGAFDGYRLCQFMSKNQDESDKCMATNEIRIDCGSSINRASHGNRKRRCVKSWW
jgi:hypothetical protein